MFNSMLDTAAMTISDKLTLGGQVTLLGVGTVFAILALIWVMVEILHVILGPKPTKKVVIKSKVNEPAKEEVVTPAPEATAPSVAPTAANDLDIIAVITAAIAAASGSAPNSFRVVSFKRANNRFSNGK